METQNKHYLLLIEDEPILADIIRKKLIQVGYEIELARDGVEGLEKIARRLPDLILLDVRLPRKDGYQVLEEIRSQERTKNIPVLVISNSGQPVEIERMLHLGICDYLIKAEFSPQEVINKVSTCLVNKPGESLVATNAGRKIMDTPKPMNDARKSDDAPAKQKKKVLLVEDDKMLSDLAYMQLMRDGFEVEIAIDGESVLPKLATFRPEIILLDIRLPDMDGFEVLQQVKNKPEYKDIPVVIISNFDQEDYHKKAKDLGAMLYLVKANLDTKSMSAEVKKIIGN